MANLYSWYTPELLATMLEERELPTENLAKRLKECERKCILECSEDGKYRLRGNAEAEAKAEAEAPLYGLMRLSEPHEATYQTIMLECQKTKTFQMIHQMFQIVGINLFSTEPCGPDSGKKVFFLVSQNLQDLTAQSCDRIVRDLGEHLQLFVFSSYQEKGPGRGGRGRKNKNPICFDPDTVDVIRYIKSYMESEEGSCKIPLCIFLANSHQFEKMRQLMEVVMDFHETTPEKIYSYLFFDEADQTYPVGRDLLLPYVFDQRVKEEYGVIRAHPSLRKIYWISATMEDMVLEYEECGIARQTPIRFQDGVVENHYSILDPSVVIHPNIQPKDEDHNSYFLRTLEENREHFFSPMQTQEGEMRYRKVIALTSKENEKQCNLARLINAMGGNVILLNQAGTFLMKARTETEDHDALGDPPAPQGGAKADEPEEKAELEVALTEPSEEAFLEGEAEAEAEEQALSGKKPKKKRFVMREGIRLDDPEIRSRNELIAKVYNELYPELKEAPLFILGNRKVDRGLTFHYAPLDEEMESFILTDVVMGRISQWRRAVQAIGRGNGVIKHRRDTAPGIHYWVDPGTHKIVTRHCQMMRDPLLFNEESTLTAAEIVTLLNEKYPDEEEAVATAASGSKRAPYIYERAPIHSSYPEMIAYLTALYPEEKFRKQWHNVEGALVSSRLKKHFGVVKVADLKPEHKCTEAMLEDPDIWKKVLYAPQFDYVVLPYYDASDLLAWTAMIKKRTPITSLSE